DRSLNVDISPKPTIFLPSVTERELHKAGTYLCLLEDFFPDVIKIDWQEKDDKTILKSQQGDTVKTNDTYMKFSWLTVSGASMDKEHKCIVKHERNKGGVDQEILFPPQKKGINKAIEGISVNIFLWQISKAVSYTLQLQLKTTSAYYTYLLLLFKSLIYSVIVAICLLGRPAFCGNGKSS
uniref:Ig-like domain-containing protein n=1 Tax=Neovison vison TaxID=452646 RepID=A0A8C7AN65_NEOVI